MNNEELNESIRSYLKERDSLVQLKEQNSSLPSNYGDSAIWLLYCLYAIPFSMVVVAGGPIIGSSIGVFAILYIMNKWLNEGKELVEEEERLAKEFRENKRKSRKKIYYKYNENGDLVEEDSA